MQIQMHLRLLHRSYSVLYWDSSEFLLYELQYYSYNYLIDYRNQRYHNLSSVGFDILKYNHYLQGLPE